MSSESNKERRNSLSANGIKPIMRSNSDIKNTTISDKGIRINSKNN